MLISSLALGSLLVTARTQGQRPFDTNTFYAPQVDVSEQAKRDAAKLVVLPDELGMEDPMLSQQWHIVNRNHSGFDLNVTQLWKNGVTGKGVKVAHIDDGVDYTHVDLKANYYAEGSWDFNTNTSDASPKGPDDLRGTAGAGSIAAAANNVCGVGVAHEAQIAGIRLLGAPITSAQEAAGLNYNFQKTSIYSCSWGPPDSGRAMAGPDPTAVKALVNGMQNGRGGKGSIFVFPAGNGGGMSDQCNFDGYANSIFTLTVGGITHDGKHPLYSERCAAVMVVAPSSGSGAWIHTTRPGQLCGPAQGGTADAAPLVAGVLALALQVRDDLSWRDVQHLAINSARLVDPSHRDWDVTASGRNYSYSFGYGMADAGRFVEAARSWKLVKPQAWFHTEQIMPPAPSILPATGASSTFEVTPEMLEKANFESLEHVTVLLWVDHPYRGDLEVWLESPNGIKSMLAEQRPKDGWNQGVKGWKFMTLKHWGETAHGTWKLTVTDQSKPDRVGNFNSWVLQLWGESIDSGKATLWSPDNEPSMADASTSLNTNTLALPVSTITVITKTRSAKSASADPSSALPTAMEGNSVSSASAGGC